MQISTPRSAEQLEQVRAPMRAFVSWHRERHVEDFHLIDAYFAACGNRLAMRKAGRFG